MNEKEINDKYLDISQRIQSIYDNLIEIFKPMVLYIREVINYIVDLANSIFNLKKMKHFKRCYYLYIHAKKWRTRKKNMKIILNMFLTYEKGDLKRNERDFI